MVRFLEILDIKEVLQLSVPYGVLDSEFQKFFLELKKKS